MHAVQKRTKTPSRKEKISRPRNPVVWGVSLAAVRLVGPKKGGIGKEKRGAVLRDWALVQVRGPLDPGGRPKKRLALVRWTLNAWEGGPLKKQKGGRGKKIGRIRQRKKTEKISALQSGWNWALVENIPVIKKNRLKNPARAALEPASLEGRKMIKGGSLKKPRRKESSRGGGQGEISCLKEKRSLHSAYKHRGKKDF